MKNGNVLIKNKEDSYINIYFPCLYSCVKYKTMYYT